MAPSASSPQRRKEAGRSAEAMTGTLIGWTFGGGRVARPEADAEAAGGDLLHGDALRGDGDRVSRPGLGYGRAELDALRDHRCGGEDGNHVRQGAATGQPEGGHAVRLRPLDRLDELGGGEAGDVDADHLLTPP